MGGKGFVDEDVEVVDDSHHLLRLESRGEGGEPCYITALRERATGTEDTIGACVILNQKLYFSPLVLVFHYH